MYLFDYLSSFRSLVERLDSHQALVKQLAKILDGVFKLDEFKMVNSGMSNDISYFRRKSQALGRKMGKENQRISATYDNIDALVRIIAFYYRILHFKPYPNRLVLSKTIWTCPK